MASRYESVVFDAIPAGCRRAVDVGCGTGELTRALRRRGIPEVVGVDRDEACIEHCRSHPGAGDIRYVAADLPNADLPDADLPDADLPDADLPGADLPAGGFHLVSAIASLHHVDARAGLLRLRELTAPGGVLVVVGLARPDLPRDLPLEIAAQLARPFRRDAGDSDGAVSAPTVWPPPERYSTMRRLAAELLPGVRWRRHLSWRYSLVWVNG